MDVPGDLKLHFGDYLNDEELAEWNHVKSLLSPGETISGQVVSCYHFGVFVDSGLGFPALLPITHFEHARERKYGAESLSDYPQLGSEVRGRLVGYSDRMRQIGLTQWKHHPALDD